MSSTLRLRPDRAVAGRWSVAAVALLALGGWLIVDADFDPVVVTMFGLFVATSAYFLLQLFLPGQFEVTFDPEGLRARTLWQHVDVAWEDIDRVEIRHFAGDHWLALDLLEEGREGLVIARQGVLLPLGTDTEVLREWLGLHRAVRRNDVDAVDLPNPF